MKNNIPFQLVSSLIACTFISNASEKQNIQNPNVLLICVDDLRPELGCYGNTYIKSPNIDHLAKKAVVFTNHFAQVPTCGASRCCLLTGMLPRKTDHLSNEACRLFISGKPETSKPETFIHHLKRNGYYTVGIGKIGHYVDGLLYEYTEPVGKEYELPYSWNEMLLNSGKWGTGWNSFFGYADGENRQSRKKQVKPYEMADVEDTGYPDGLIAEQALTKMDELAKKEQPFFLAVGFFKPHLPFNAPKKYWDMYNESKIPLSPNPFIPKNINKASLHNSGEFNGYELGEEKASLNGPISDAYARKLKHGYFACVSYIDEQIGKILNKIVNLGLEEKTVIIIWGDHGWHLGDHLVWGKHTIFERALKSALIIKIPGMTHGDSISRIVSTIDIYPTVVELCKLQMPHKTDGKSLVPLLTNPDAEWEDISFGYFKNGISLRTERYRLTQYFRDQEPAIELYDHKNDPYETKNIANDYSEITKQLLPKWEKGNTGVMKEAFSPLN